MSLDISLVCAACEHETCSKNITYNLSRMWYAVRPDDDRMLPLEGMTGEASLPVLDAALAALLADPARFEALNPANGWGSYAGLVAALGDMRSAAAKAPQGVWRAWR